MAASPFVHAKLAALLLVLLTTSVSARIASAQVATGSIVGTVRIRADSSSRRTGHGPRGQPEHHDNARDAMRAASIPHRSSCPAPTRCRSSSRDSKPGSAAASCCK